MKRRWTAWGTWALTASSPTMWTCSSRGRAARSRWAASAGERMHLSRMTWTEAAELFARRPIALWPVGSTEPHGPHLPLATDVIIAEAMAARVHALLEEAQLPSVVLPS